MVWHPTRASLDEEALVRQEGKELPLLYLRLLSRDGGTRTRSSARKEAGGELGERELSPRGVDNETGGWVVSRGMCFRERGGERNGGIGGGDGPYRLLFPLRLNADNPNS